MSGWSIVQFVFSVCNSGFQGTIDPRRCGLTPTIVEILHTKDCAPQSLLSHSSTLDILSNTVPCESVLTSSKYTFRPRPQCPLTTFSQLSHASRHTTRFAIPPSMTYLSTSEAFFTQSNLLLQARPSSVGPILPFPRPGRSSTAPSRFSPSTAHEPFQAQLHLTDHPSYRRE